ncbi:hypothetical protein D3C81_1681040 [compost metagenome]
MTAPARHFAAILIGVIIANPDASPKPAVDQIREASDVYQIACTQHFVKIGRVSHRCAQRMFFRQSLSDRIGIVHRVIFGYRQFHMAVFRVRQDLFSYLLDIVPCPFREAGDRLITLFRRRAAVHRKAIVPMIQVQGQVIDPLSRDFKHRLIPVRIGMPAG